MCDSQDDTVRGSSDSNRVQQTWAGRSSQKKVQVLQTYCLSHFRSVPRGVCSCDTMRAGRWCQSCVVCDKGRQGSTQCVSSVLLGGLQHTHRAHLLVGPRFGQCHRRWHSQPGLRSVHQRLSTGGPVASSSMMDPAAERAARKRKMKHQESQGP